MGTPKQTPMYYDSHYWYSQDGARSYWKPHINAYDAKQSLKGMDGGTQIGSPKNIAGTR